MADDTTFKLISAWEQFKQVNDARLREIDRMGHADPLFGEHLRNINTALDNPSDLTDRTRPPVNPSDGTGGEYGRAFRAYLRKGMDAGLESLQAKTMSAGSDPDGGYGHLPGGGVEAVGDFLSREAAEQTFQRITGIPFAGSHEAQDHLRVMHAGHALVSALGDLLEQLRALGIPDWHGAEGLSLEQADTALTEATGRAS